MVSLLLLAAAASLPAEQVSFREHVIATDLRGGYQVVAADVNGDGKTDLIALASGIPELYWFEAPDWKRHLMASNLPRMINLAAADTDGDRIPEVVLAHEFNNDPAKSIGIVSILTHDGDPTKPWKVREIDRLSTSHRIRAARLDGKIVFINAPLAGADSKPPEYRAHVPLVAYRPGEWKRETISNDDEGVVHGLWVGRWNHKDKNDSVLTSSFKGIYRHTFQKGAWKRELIAKGDPSPWPRSGSSEITPGEGWYASLEPWHGNQVVVYDRKSGRRDVIETRLVDGHVLLTADFDGDRKSEILSGYRGVGRSVYLYRKEATDGKWARQTVDDGGISAAGCAIADLNGDGRLDIACIGSATTNLKWYENLGRNPNSGGR
jgi:hypothetical protein